MGKTVPKGLSRKVKKKRARAAAVLVACLALLGGLTGAVLGRFQRQLDSEGSVRAKEFYFTSDFLDGGTHTLAPGSAEVAFTLGNHADELRFSEVDITYTVTVVTPDGGPGTPIVTYGNTEQKLTQDTKQDDTVTIAGLQPGTYTIKATGTGGYEKTLTATLVVPSAAAQIYQHQENVPGEYLLVTVWNEGDTDGKVTIAYTGIPDNTNPNMGDWTTAGGAQNVEIKAHTSKVFRFFSGTVTVNYEGTNTSVETKNPA